MYTIAIVGSREYPRLSLVRQYVNELIWGKGLTIVSGGAIGVDAAAIETARLRGFPTIEIKPSWGRHGKSAGFIRNREIVACADRVVAFWDGKSRGTKHTIEITKQAGKWLEVFDLHGHREVYNQP